jgi:Rhodopirellula transposase DDE domain
LVGNFANGGQEWQPSGEPERVNVHDFPDPKLGKAIPYGVYACDLTRRGCLRSSACLPMLGSVRLRGHAHANFPPGAARRLPG